LQRVSAVLNIIILFVAIIARFAVVFLTLLRLQAALWRLAFEGPSRTAASSKIF
jgi:hypothetical protein